MEIKIEKGIPIPRKKGEGLPFEKLKVGESFFIEMKKQNLYQQANNYRAKHKDFGFIVRGEKNGARIWRTKLG